MWSIITIFGFVLVIVVYGYVSIYASKKIKIFKELFSYKDLKQVYVLNSILIIYWLGIKELYEYVVNVEKILIEIGVKGLVMGSIYTFNLNKMSKLIYFWSLIVLLILLSARLLMKKESHKIKYLPVIFIQSWIYFVIFYSIFVIILAFYVVDGIV